MFTFYHQYLEEPVFCCQQTSRLTWGCMFPGLSQQIVNSGLICQFCLFSLFCFPTAATDSWTHEAEGEETGVIASVVAF